MHAYTVSNVGRYSGKAIAVYKPSRNRSSAAELRSDRSIQFAGIEMGFCWGMVGLLCMIMRVSIMYATTH